MNKEQNTNQYLVPANVSARFEFFSGFGWSELKIVLASAVIGILIFSFLGIFTKTVHIDSENVTDFMVSDNSITIHEDGSASQRVENVPMILRIITVIVPTGVSFMLVKRDPNNGMNLLEMLKSFRRFKQKQKLYLYKYNSGSEV